MNKCVLIQVILKCLQVYFIEDVEDSEWRVVRLKEPRSRRMIDDDDQRDLSAPGPPNATRLLHRIRRRETPGEDNAGETVLRAAVDEVVAREIVGDEEAIDPDDDSEEDNDGIADGENTNPQAGLYGQPDLQPPETEDDDPL